MTMFFFFFEGQSMWRQYMKELGIQGTIDYLRGKGLPARWPEMVVDPEEFGSLIAKAGNYKSRCPYFGDYWLHGGIGSFECRAAGEMIPGIAWYKVCSADFEKCPFYKMKTAARQGQP